MFNLIYIWLGMLGLMLALSLTRRFAFNTLSLAYFLLLSLIHVPGALAQANLQFGLTGQYETQLGFEYTLLGLAGFLGGSLLAYWRPFRRPLAVPIDFAALSMRDRVWLDHTGTRFLIGGIISYFILPRILGAIPSITSIISSMAVVIVVGLWLRLVSAEGVSFYKQIFNCVIAVFFPIITIISIGFMGYGVSWLVSSLLLLFNISKTRILVALMFPVLIYFGLSVFCTYLGNRADLRQSVWSGASFADRFDVAFRTAEKFEWFDYNNPIHLRLVDSRLNQNYLVGRAVDNVEAGGVPLAHGESISPMILIPRAIWPDKPAVGGGGDLVTRYTGIGFSLNTSVGAGQVLEFFVNFGKWGMVCCFVGLGWILRRLDLNLGQSLLRCDVRGVLRAGLVGLALLQPGGNLIEILVSAAAALVVGWGINRYLYNIVVPRRPALQNASRRLQTQVG